MWAIHLRHLCQTYGLLDPLEYLKVDPPSKSVFKENILTQICSHYERSLRSMADNNSKMLYLNVLLTGLRGRHHPSLAGLITTQLLLNMKTFAINQNPTYHFNQL